jgi:hypothetical protein
VHRAREFLRQFAQVEEIKQPIAVGYKAGRSIIAALDEMDSHMGKNQARLSWHNGKTASRCNRLTEIGL